MWHPEQPPSTHPSRAAVFGLSDPLFFLPRGDDVLEEAAILAHFSHRPPLVEQRSGGAYLHALAATGAGVRTCPRARQDSVMTCDPAPRPETSQVWAPSTSSQTRTQRVHRMQRFVIDAEALVAGIDRKRRKPGKRQTDVIDAPSRLARSCKLAGAVGDTHRADVVALGQQQLSDESSCGYGQQPGRVGQHLHAFLHGCETGGLQLPPAFHLNHAQPARAHIAGCPPMWQRRGM